MKTNKILYFLAATTMLFTACENDPLDDIKLPDVSPEIEAISAKWVNNDTNSKYHSFEFQTDGTYIVQEYATTNSTSSKTKTLRVKSLNDLNLPKSAFYNIKQKSDRPELRATSKTLVTYVGHYVLSGGTITLTDYGLIEKFQASNDEFEFTFKPDGSVQTIEFVGTKQPTLYDSKKTTLLCRMWKVEKTKFKDIGSGLWSSILGDTWDAMLSELMDAFTHPEVNGEQVDLCVMMSKSGTYLSIFRDKKGNFFTEIAADNGDSLLGVVSTVVGTWEWADGKEKDVNWSNEGSFGMGGSSGTFTVDEVTLEKFIYTTKTSSDSSSSGIDLNMEITQELSAVNKL